MSKESSFIHDLLTPLSVAHAHSRMVRAALAGDPDQLDLVDLKRRMDRCFDSLEKLVQLIAERRAAVNEQSK